MSHPRRPWCIRSIRAVAPLLILLLCSPAATAQPPSAPPPAAEVAPAIAFEEAAVLITGATPEGEVVVFGLGRDRQRAIPRTLRMEQLLAADADGALRWELPEPVMARSVWAAVDLATGEYVLAAPEGHEIERVERPAQGLGANARFLDHEGRFLDLLLVRPAIGPGGEVTSALAGEKALNTSTELSVTESVTVSVVAAQSNAPGRGAPPPTAIPGAKERTTPAPEPRQGAADDNKQPPQGNDIFNKGVDPQKKKILDLLADWLDGAIGS